MMQPNQEIMDFQKKKYQKLRGEEEGNLTTGNHTKKNGAPSQKAVQHLQLHFMVVFCMILFSR